MVGIEFYYDKTYAKGFRALYNGVGVDNQQPVEAPEHKAAPSKKKTILTSDRYLFAEGEYLIDA